MPCDLGTRARKEESRPPTYICRQLKAPWGRHSWGTAPGLGWKDGNAGGRLEDVEKKDCRKKTKRRRQKYRRDPPQSKWTGDNQSNKLGSIASLGRFDRWTGREKSRREQTIGGYARVLTSGMVTRRGLPWRETRSLTDVKPRRTQP